MQSVRNVLYPGTLRAQKITPNTRRPILLEKSQRCRIWRPASGANKLNLATKLGVLALSELFRSAVALNHRLTVVPICLLAFCSSVGDFLKLLSLT